MHNFRVKAAHGGGRFELRFEPAFFDFFFSKYGVFGVRDLFKNAPGGDALQAGRLWACFEPWRTRLGDFL